MPARLIAIDSETLDIKVPNSYQVILERGDRLGWYIMWHNDTGRDIEHVYVEAGKVLSRLESDMDAEGMVSSVEQKIFRRFFKLFDAILELKPNHTYRIVGVYDNPTGETIPMGGMAQIGALFRPDDTALGGRECAQSPRPRSAEVRA